MNTELFSKISALTEEERRILRGELLNKELYSSGGDFTVGAEKMLEPGRDISVRTHTRFVDFPEHRHNYLEIMAVISGEITHRIYDSEITLGAGDILVLNKHVFHSIKRADEGDIGINIILSDGFTNSLSSELSSTVFSELVSENTKSDGVGMYLAFRAYGNPMVENVIENILFELGEYRADTAILKKTVSLLFDHLSRGGGRMLTAASRLPDEAGIRKNAVRDYIKNNCKSASLGELCEEMYLSAPYLSKLIKAYFGKGFKELLLEERVCRAKQMLSDTDVPVFDIIHSVGYENESYFHKAFKKAVGLSPLAYRKACAKSAADSGADACD